MAHKLNPMSQQLCQRSPTSKQLGCTCMHMLHICGWRITRRNHPHTCATNTHTRSHTEAYACMHASPHARASSHSTSHSSSHCCCWHWCLGDDCGLVAACELLQLGQVQRNLQAAWHTAHQDITLCPHRARRRHKMSELVKHVHVHSFYDRQQWSKASSTSTCWGLTSVSLKS